MKRNLQLAAVLASAIACGAAQAQSLDWSYTYGDGNVLSGVFTGADAGNYFTVTGLQSIFVNGVSQSSYLTGATLESVDALENLGEGYNGNGTAVVTLDGSYMDLIDTPDGGKSGFIFAVGDAFSQLNFNYTAYSLPAGSDGDFPFLQARWSATLVDIQLPEPTSLTILVAGLAAAYCVRRRRAA